MRSNQKESVPHDGSLRNELPIFVAVVSAGVLIRLACLDLPNFAPVAAIGMFAGFYFYRRSLALLVPLAIMAISDRWAGGYSWLVMSSVYTCFLVPPLLGRALRPRYTKLSLGAKIVARAAVLAAALGGSLLFFLVTNFAVWAASSNLGFVQCYVEAIPFYRFTLFGDLFFSATLFTAYDVCCVVAARLNRHHQDALVSA